MKKRYPLIILGLAVMALAACAELDPKATRLNPHRAGITEGTYVRRIDADLLDNETLDRIGEEYYRHGAGLVNVTVTYDPASRDNTALTAQRTGARIANDLRVRGVRDIDVDVLPVKGGGPDHAEVLLTFTRLGAAAPEACDEMPGMVTPRTISEEEDLGGYRLGCSIEGLIVRQLARPADLAGRPDPNRDSDGTRASEILLEGYLSGKQNEPLQGESASGDE